MQLKSLGTAASTRPGRVGHVELLGTRQHLRWHQSASALHVTLPAARRPVVDYAAALKIHLA
jgi:hypothetical protein